MRVSTTQYRFSHGRDPRGTGLWAFEMGAHGRPSETYFAQGTYAQARREATRQARAMDYDWVQVLP